MIFDPAFKQVRHLFRPRRLSAIVNQQCQRVIGYLSLIVLLKAIKVVWTPVIDEMLHAAQY